MKTKSNIRLLFISFILMTAFSLTACGVTNKNAPPQPGPGNVKLQGQNMNNENMQGTPRQPDNLVPQVTQEELANGKTKADNIQNRLSTMQDIRNPLVVVLGNTAVVGFTPANPSKNSIDIQSSLMNRVRQIDSSIANVYTTDSPDIIKKIVQVSSDIANNRPAVDVGNRFNQLKQMVSPVNR